MIRTRQELTEAILAAKRDKGLTYESIGKAIGRHKVWAAAACTGQATCSAEEAARLLETVGLDKGLAPILAEVPYRGAEPQVPLDPLLYRFHEINLVYGPAIKAVIHEMFGDGIMSAIDFDIEIERRPDPKGDRVVVTYNGKFLQYKKW